MIIEEMNIFHHFYYKHTRLSAAKRFPKFERQIHAFCNKKKKKAVSQTMVLKTDYRRQKPVKALISFPEKVVHRHVPNATFGLFAAARSPMETCQLCTRLIDICDVMKLLALG